MSGASLQARVVKARTARAMDQRMITTSIVYGVVTLTIEMAQEHESTRGLAPSRPPLL